MASNRLFFNIRYFGSSNRYFDAKIHNKTNVYDFYTAIHFRNGFSSVAPTFSVLLVGRVIQVAGLAINLPLTQNVIFTIFPPNKRGGAMGVMGLVMLAG
jgi:predicted MFS family arabinose efflux permease